MAASSCYAERMSLGVPIIVAAALIGAALTISHRYAISAHACGADEGNCSRVWRVDQWTGEILFCQNKPPGIGAICVRAML
jgi:hypothetical protein